MSLLFSILLSLLITSDTLNASMDSSQQTITCLKSTVETLEKKVKSVHSWDTKTAKNVCTVSNGNFEQVFKYREVSRC